VTHGATRHFLVADYVVPVYLPENGSLSLGGDRGRDRTSRARYLRQYGISQLTNFVVRRLDTGTVVRAAYSDVTHGHLLVSAPSLSGAYRAAKAIDAFFFLVVGHAADLQRSAPKLTELKCVPDAAWTRARLWREIVGWDIGIPEFYSYVFYSGHVVHSDEMRRLGQFLERIYPDDSLCEALLHLGYSRYLFNGYMTGGHYYRHYYRDREDMSEEQLNRAYYEHRELFELAFTAAFKALERILKVTQIRKHDIPRALASISAGITGDVEYTRRHETFSGLEEKVSYADIVAHFLDMRNAAAAHANPTPPRHLRLSEDSLIEIQLFVSEVCSRIIGPLTEAELPVGAVQAAPEKGSGPKRRS
jgi:hypothetical protein